MRYDPWPMPFLDALVCGQTFQESFSPFYFISICSAMDLDLVPRFINSLTELAQVSALLIGLVTVWRPAIRQ